MFFENTLPQLLKHDLLQSLNKRLVLLVLTISCLAFANSAFAATNNFAGTLTYPSLSYTAGAAITTLSPSTNTTTTGTYSVTTGTIPAGLALNTATGNITGTPTTVAAAVSLVITRSGAGGAVSGTFTITIIAPVLTYGTGNSYVAGTTITTLSPSTNTTTGGTYSVTTGTLPIGLTLNTGTGAITGTPTVPAASVSIVVTRSGAYGAVSNTFTIIIPAAPPTVTGTTTLCGSGTTTLTSSDVTTGGTYNWYTASSGGTLLSTGPIYSPYVLTTTTYYAEYTSSGSIVSTRTAQTVTVNSTIGVAPAQPGLSYVFTGNANDVSGSGNTGTLQNTPTSIADRFGSASSAYSFNSSSQYISTATNIAAPGPANFTLSIWFNTTTTTGGKLIGFGSSQTGGSGQYDRHIYMADNGLIYFGLYNGGVKTLNSTKSLNDGLWHHAVATMSSSLGSLLYIDDVLQGTDATMNTGENHAGYWRIAYDSMSGWTASPTSAFFNGSLDDIDIYNTALTSAQIIALNGATVATNPICAGSTLTLQATTVSGATGYSWTGPNSFTSTSQNPTITNSTTAASGNYIVTVTGAGGCISKAMTVATVNAAPSATFTTSASSVALNTNIMVTYTGTDPNTSTYSWNFNGGTPSTGTGQGPFTVQWASYGAKTITLTITNANGCTASYTQTVTVNYSTYSYAMPLTLNTTGLGITSNLTNFPFLVTITDPSLVYTAGACNNKVQFPNGPAYDFAFLSGSTEVPYQVESYNQVTGTLLVWVQIPSLTYTINNAITFYYGNATAPATHSTAFYQTTWGSDYKAVYHFGETSYTGSATDATNNGKTGTISNMTAANLVTGKIGTAYSFNGSNTGISNASLTLTGTFTLSAWVNLSATGIDQKIMTNQSSAGASSGGYKLGIFNNNYPETESATAGDRGSTPLPPAVTTSTWYYIQGVYTGANLYTYVNGVQYENLATTTSPSSTNPFYIGVGEGGTQYYFNGIIDEPRVSNVGKTSDWLKAEYNNQNAPASYIIQGTIGSTASGALIAGELSYTWTGTTSTDPGIGTNWANTVTGATGTIPGFTGNSTIIIPTGLTNYPVLTGSAALYGLTIGSGASVNLNGFTIYVGCNIVNSSGGQILYGGNINSALNWNGSLATQTYTGSSTPGSTTLGNMTINNSSTGTVTISGGPVDIYGSLNLTKGNLVISSSPAALTLKSTSAQTAYVAAITAGTITGNVNVERYMVGGSAAQRGYRLLSSPVNQGIITGTGQVGYGFTDLQATVPITGYGVTGTYTGTLTANVFDASGLANPTVFFYNEADLDPINRSIPASDYKGISAMTDKFFTGNGFLFFFRGNRNATDGSSNLKTTTAAIPENTTMNFTGTLNQGNIDVYIPTSPIQTILGNKVYVTPTTSAAISKNFGYTANAGSNNGLHLVGNPYASPVDLEAITLTNAGSTSIYMLNNAGVMGAYIKGSNSTSLSNGVGRYLLSGQGFFVYGKSTGNTTLTFTESCKVTAASPSPTSFSVANPNNYFAGGDVGLAKLAVAKPSAPAITPSIKIALALDSTNMNETTITFGSKNKFDPMEDAYYQSGLAQTTFMASYTTDSKPCLINQMGSLDSIKTIPLYAEGQTTGKYTMQFSGVSSIDPRYKIYLKDNLLKDSVDIAATSIYTFNIDRSNTATYGATRFSLVVLPSNIADLYSLVTFAGTKNSLGISLLWKAKYEGNYTGFTLQRSTDGGKTYKDLTVLQSDGSGTYNYTDMSPSNGTNMYRLVQNNINNINFISDVVTISYLTVDSKTGKLNIFPNPVTSIIQIKLDQAVNATLNVKIYSIIGNPVMTSKFTPGNTLSLDVSKLAKGNYVVEVTDSRNNFYGSTTFSKL